MIKTKNKIIVTFILIFYCMTFLMACSGGNKLTSKDNYKEDFLSIWEMYNDVNDSSFDILKAGLPASFSIDAISRNLDTVEMLQTIFSQHKQLANKLGLSKLYDDFEELLEIEHEYTSFLLSYLKTSDRYSRTDNPYDKEELDKIRTEQLLPKARERLDKLILFIDQLSELGWY